MLLLLCALLTETGEDVGRVLADDGPRPPLLLFLPALAAVLLLLAAPRQHQTALLFMELLH